ncbi:MAG: hypothetical protein QG567_2213 [Campylobacterota bacterium]|nr:hypothetical protein [Campylobacterota bacterium]
MERAVVFFLSIFILSIVGGIFINPKETTVQLKEKVAEIEFKGYTFYHIDTKGVAEYLVSSEGYRFEGVDVVKDVKYYKKDKNGLNTIMSDQAFVYDGYFDFNGTVFYKVDDKYSLNTQDVRYNKEKNMITGSKPFVISSKSGEFSGGSFVVDLQSKSFEAKEIKAVYFYE